MNLVGKTPNEIQQVLAQPRFEWAKPIVDPKRKPTKGEIKYQPNTHLKPRPLPKLTKDIPTNLEGRPDITQIKKDAEELNKQNFKDENKKSK